MTRPEDSDYSLDLPNDARAAGQARSGLNGVLRRWRLPGLVDRCLLAASELVTNAVRHGTPPVNVALHRDADDVRLDVSDASPVSPRARAASADDEGGRGMEIVQAVSDEVGVEQIPHDGKRVFVRWHNTRQP